jgi:hypothetical protein
MSRGSAKIVACPAALVDQALAIVLAELAPAERQALAASSRAGKWSHYA